MVTVKLFKTTSDNREVNKILSAEKNIDNVTLKGETSLTRPSFMLRKGENGYFTGYNYLYCPELSRYYYIDNITFMPGDFVSLECSVDALMSYAGAIRSLTALVDRQESIYNPYLDDSGIVITQGSVIKAIDVGLVGDATYTTYMTAIGAVEEVANE